MNVETMVSGFILWWIVFSRAPTFEKAADDFCFVFFVMSTVTTSYTRGYDFWFLVVLLLMWSAVVTWISVTTRPSWITTRFPSVQRKKSSYSPPTQWQCFGYTFLLTFYCSGGQYYWYSYFASAIVAIGLTSPWDLIKKPEVTLSSDKVGVILIVCGLVRMICSSQTAVALSHMLFPSWIFKENWSFYAGILCGVLVTWNGVTAWNMAKFTISLHVCAFVTSMAIMDCNFIVGAVLGFFVAAIGLIQNKEEIFRDDASDETIDFQVTSDVSADANAGRCFSPALNRWTTHRNVRHEEGRLTAN